MTKPIVSTFAELSELMIQQYERYLPTAYDEGLSLVQKMNKVIVYLNEMGKLTNDVVKQWNDVVEWILNESLSEEITLKLDEMVTDGTMATLINEVVFADLNTHLDEVDTLAKKLEDRQKDTVYIKDYPLIDLTGSTNTTTAFETAFNAGGILQLPEVCTILIDKTFLLTGGKEIHGKGRDSVLKLASDVTLFDIRSSAIVLKNLRIVVPDANTQAVIKLTPQTGTVMKYCEIDNVFIESVGNAGNWVGIQWDLTNGFLLYRNDFKVNMQYPKIGLDVIGTYGATGNLFDGEIGGALTAINIQPSDSFQNNRFVGEIQDLRLVDTVGVYMSRGWGNRFELNCWYDAEIGKFTPYHFESTAFNNRVEGHFEGKYIDYGDNNIFNATFYKADYSLVPRSQSTYDYKDVLNNELPAPMNLLVNSGFTIGGTAGWTEFSGRVTHTRDSATFGYPTLKVTQADVTRGWSYQGVEDFEQYRGKTVYAGCWVYVSSVNTGDSVSGIAIDDGLTPSYSDLAIENGQWQWITVKHKVSNDATGLTLSLGRIDPSLNKLPNIGDVFFFSKPVLLMGGKYRPQHHVPEKRLLKYTPTNNATIGKKGDMCYDDTYLYVWINDNSVRRSPLSTW